MREKNEIKIFYDEFGNVVHKEKIQRSNDERNIKEIDEFLANSLIDKILDNGILDLSNFSKLEIIEYNAFANKKIKKIVLPKSVKMICSLAFANNLIDDLDLSDVSNLEVVEDYAFSNNPLEIEKIKLPKNIKSIGERLF